MTGLNPKRVLLVVTGESMNPAILDGDIILYETCRTQNLPIGNWLHRIRNCGQVAVLKRSGFSRPTVHRLTILGDAKGDRVKREDTQLTHGNVEMIGIVRGRLVREESGKLILLDYGHWRARWRNYVLGVLAPLNRHRLIVLHRAVQVIMDWLGSGVRSSPLAQWNFPIDLGSAEISTWADEARSPR